MNTFKSWIESHYPELNWDWSNPKSVEEQLIQCIRLGGAVNLAPVFKLFFSQGYSGLDMTFGSEETIWLNYFKEKE